MSIIEAKRRDVLKKIQKIKKDLPKIEKLVKEGKIQYLLQKDLVVVDCMQSVFQVRAKNSKVEFLICDFD